MPVSLKKAARPVTLQAIAKRVGASVMTVSRVLNGQHDVQNEAAIRRAEQIRRVAEEMGYRRNMAANAILKGRFNAVGLIQGLDPERNQLQPRRLAGLTECLGQHQNSLMVSAVAEERLEDEAYVPKILSQMMVDGIIVGLYRGVPPRFEELIDRYRVPVVWINSLHSHDSVFPDDRGGGKQLTQHLINLGHRRVAYYRPTTDEGPLFLHYSLNHRWQGYLDAMEEARLKPMVIQSERRLLPYDRVSFLRSQFAMPDRPTALVTYRVADAASAIRAAAMAGLAVPEDLSVATFQDDPPDTGLALGVTAVQLPEYELGQTAAQMLLKKIEKPGYQHPPRAIGMMFDEGHTAMPPRLV